MSTIRIIKRKAIRFALKRPKSNKEIVVAMSHVWTRSGDDGPTFCRFKILIWSRRVRRALRRAIVDFILVSIYFHSSIVACVIDVINRAQFYRYYLAQCTSIAQRFEKSTLSIFTSAAAPYVGNVGRIRIRRAGDFL